MPYRIFKLPGKSTWRVYKLDDDGKRTGKGHGNHDTIDSARAQMRALYAAENDKVSELVEPVELTGDDVPDLQFSKDQVAYQDPSPALPHRCGNCTHFHELRDDSRDGKSACRLVEGDISEDAWCEEWDDETGNIMGVNIPLDPPQYNNSLTYGLYEMDEDMSAGDVIQEIADRGASENGGRKVTVREIRVHQFAGKNYPAIENYPAVDMAMLTEGDDKPFYVVLPIAESGRVSGNSLAYDGALVSTIAEQLSGLGGIRGHIPDDQRSTYFPVEDVDWIGHKLVGETLYAKGYIPPGETRDYVRRLKARNGKLSTSIYGEGVLMEQKDGTRRLSSLNLEAVDLAPAARAALKIGNGSFSTVYEMNRNTGAKTMEKSELKSAFNGMGYDDILDTLGEDFIAQLTRQHLVKNNRTSVTSEMLSQISELDKSKTQITELQTRNSALERDMNAANSRIAEYERVEFEAGLEGIVKELISPKGEETRPEFAQMGNALRAQLKSQVNVSLNGKRDLAMANAVAQQIAESDSFRPLLTMRISQMSGGNAIAGAAGVNGKPTPEDIINAANEQRHRAM